MFGNGPGLRAGGAFLACAALGCAPVGDDEAAATSAATAPYFNLTFEGDPLGAPRPPWSVSGSGSTAAVVSTADHGKALRVNGGAAAGAYVTASYQPASASGDVTLRFDVNPAAGAAFVAWLAATGGYGASNHQLRVQRLPGSDALLAAATGGNVSCGAVRSGAWTTVSIVLHATAPRTFDVLINGARTPCAGLPTRLQPPFVGLGLMDASNEGWGGAVTFDNLTMF